jgi:hypothetical protein
MSQRWPHEKDSYEFVTSVRSKALQAVTLFDGLLNQNL